MDATESLTPLRREVLQVVAGQAGPLRVYDVVALLRTRRPSATATSVYRSLHWLEQRQRVRRLASARAFIACAPDIAASPALLVCSRCFVLRPVDHRPLHRLLEEAASIAGYSACRPVLEIWGVCAACMAEEPRSATP